VLDGSLDTFWHSRWSPSVAPPPHSLTIDFGQPLNVAAVVYEARRDMDHGHVKDYEVYLSRDGNTWGEPVARGTFRKGALTQTIRLPEPVSGRFLKFVALSEQSGAPYATAAELNVIEAGK
jgi:beta-galactosidase